MADNPSRLPLYQPLGFTRPRYGCLLYYLRIDGVERVFRGCEMQTVQFLFDLLPDAEHWRSVFPGERRGRVDTIAAAAHFIRLCRAKGEYQPESHVLLSEAPSK